MRARAFLPLFALLVTAGAHAALSSTWELDFDEQTKGWKEIEAQIPPYPQEKNLVLVDGLGVDAHKYYIDTGSVSLGQDGVTRYTAVLKTSGGATNVTFEGIRCETREHKLYALGHKDSTWARARDPKWERIARHTKPYPWMLYSDYFCTSPSRPTSPRDAISAMKRGVGFAPRALD